jgi:hypothetical protein
MGHYSITHNFSAPKKSIFLDMSSVMIKKDPSLSVRAVVFENNKAIATVTYGNILSSIPK